MGYCDAVGPPRTRRGPSPARGTPMHLDGPDPRPRAALHPRHAVRRETYADGARLSSGGDAEPSRAAAGIAGMSHVSHTSRPRRRVAMPRVVPALGRVGLRLGTRAALVAAALLALHGCERDAEGRPPAAPSALDSALDRR